MTYHSRLKLLNPESLELRRLRSDLSLVYKVLFGIVCIDSDALFIVRNQPHLRGHNYTIVKPRFVSSVRRGFFSTRVINICTTGLLTHLTLVVCASFVHQLLKTIYSHLVQSILCDVLIVLTFPSSTYYM